MNLPDTARTLIESGCLAHCTTLNADGSPQVSAVWIGLDGDEVVMGHLGEHRKVRNLRRDPRVAFSLAAPDDNGIGMQHHLVLHGTATVTAGGAPDLLRRLAAVYVPSGAFVLPDGAPEGVVVRVRVDRIGGLGPWTG